ncbi:MAG: FHA domain-containing protein [Deltaproteobacteria bacterium]|nr:FHA domain-containing protein [Deltaproteobacteria bacterium]
MAAKDTGAGGIPAVHLIVRLELPDKPPREFTYDFRQEMISIGRDPTNDIQIPLTTVSRRHAQIFYERGDYFLEDLGSTHGTQVNDQVVKGKRSKKLLKDGDVIRIMSFSITFKAHLSLFDRKPGENTELLTRRLVEEVLGSLDSGSDPTTLRVMSGPDEGRRYEVREEQTEVVIGRSPECEITIDDQNASRRHGLVKRTMHGFTVQDLGSKNGVLVNGVRISEAKELKDGDEIQLGGTKIIFIDPASRLLAQMGMAQEETAVSDGDSPERGEGEEPEAEDPAEESNEGGEEAPAEPEVGEESEEPAEGAVAEGEAAEEPVIELPEGVKPPKGPAAEVIILVIAGLLFFGLAGVLAWIFLF